MIVILQPLIPHYREDFWKGINSYRSSYIYIYQKNARVNKNKFNIGGIEAKYIKNISIKDRILIYSIFPFFRKKYNILVLPLHFGHITTWILLMTKHIHKKKIVLMGQGISVKRYVKESKKPSLLIKIMIKLADILWLYTERQKEQWARIYPNKDIVALDNTISGIENIIKINKSEEDIRSIKQKEEVIQDIVLIFCARFNSPNRRVDLLEYVISKLDNTRFGFIIIGDGDFKPDFSKYSNVYDYGTVYDQSRKDDLFSISDIYFQPAWLGLSIVEALGYGKPVFTLQRSESEIMQGVEVSYIQNNINGFIFNNIDDCIAKINKITKDEIKKMGLNAKKYVKENLMMSQMIENAVNSLKKY
jgi:hypothetical protein